MPNYENLRRGVQNFLERTMPGIASAIAKYLPRSAIESTDTYRGRETKLRRIINSGWDRAFESEGELDKERRAREEIMKGERRELTQEYLQNIESMAEALKKIRENMEASVAEAKTNETRARQQEAYAKDALATERRMTREIKRNKALIPVLRFYEEISPEFGNTSAILMDDRLQPVYATRTFKEMMGIEEEELPEIAYALGPISSEGQLKPRDAKVELTFRERTYELRQKSYQILDGQGDHIGTLVHLTKLDPGFIKILSKKTKDLARREHGAIKGLMTLIREGLFHPPEPNSTSSFS